MKTTVFNPIQIHLLKMFERKNSEEDLLELQEVLSHYYSNLNNSQGTKKEAFFLCHVDKNEYL